MRAAALAFALLIPSDVPAAQESPAGSTDPERMPRPEMHAVRTTARITLDGSVTEPAWSAAPPITEFVQAQPRTGQPATERTVVRVLFDDTNLYVSAVCYDSEPDAMVIKTIERDFPGVLSEDMDSFGVAFDTFLDRRNSFLFFINPRGGVKDGQTFNDGVSRDYGWDGIVHIATVVHDSGWTLEMAVPWTTLRFDPARADQRWGVNFLRRIRRKNEVAYWAPLARRERIFLMSQAGMLTGLPRLSAGRNLWLKPFVLARRSTGASLEAPEVGNDGDAGGDVKWGITPHVTLDLTLRTDFSQADVDQEQVNLTRFPLFFPEQRDFFLENSGIFTLGDVTAPGAPRSGTSTRDFTLFHSRTIGLRRGRPVPLFGGARFTGRAASFEFGALNVQSEEFEGNPAENFSAVRVRRNVLGNSDLGFLFTNRDATGSASAGIYNRAFGTDLNLRLAQFLFVSSYFALSRAPGGGGEAGRIAVGWRDRVWDASAMVRTVDDDFSPGMGFVRRTGIRQYYATVGAHPRPGIGGVLEVNPYAEADYITDHDGTRITWDGALGFDVGFTDGGQLSLQYRDRRERLEEPFAVQPTVAIPVGDYHFREASASYATSEGRRLAGAMEISGGGYYDGTRYSVEGRVLWQPGYRLTVEGSAAYNAVSVQRSDFTADLYAWRIKYAFSTALYVGLFMQYNADVDQLVTNARLNFIHAPLSDVFLVLTERRDLDANAVLERFVTLKVTRLLGF